MTYQRAFLVIDRQQLVMLPDLGADSKRARRSGRTFSNIPIVAHGQLSMPAYAVFLMATICLTDSFQRLRGYIT
jgi:hypothetical protein